MSDILDRILHILNSINDKLIVAANINDKISSPEILAELKKVNEQLSDEQALSLKQVHEAIKLINSRVDTLVKVNTGPTLADQIMLELDELSNKVDTIVHIRAQDYMQYASNEAVIEAISATRSAEHPKFQISSREMVNKIVRIHWEHTGRIPTKDVIEAIQHSLKWKELDPTLL
jgi:hypothetical protein